MRGGSRSSDDINRYSGITAVIAEMKIKEMSAPEKQIDETVFLDPDQKSPRAQDFEERLGARIVGQERAVRRMSGLYQIFLAGMNPMNRPIGTPAARSTMRPAMV